MLTPNAKQRPSASKARLVAQVTSTDTKPPALPSVAADGSDLPRSGTNAVVGWGVLVVTAMLLGPRWLTEEGSVRAPPVMGHWHWQTRGHLAVVVPFALAVATIVYGPRLASTLRWRTLVIGAGAMTTLWSLALAAADGWSQVTFPLRSRHEYLAVVDRIESPGDFLRTFFEQYESLPIHAQGHPPGMPLLLWGMDRLGLGGAGWAAALALAGAGLATAATLVAVRSVAGGNDRAHGEAFARRAAPFVAVAPAGVWLGTSTDAFFAGVVALGVALLVTVGPEPETGLPPDDPSTVGGHVSRAHPAIYGAGGVVLAGALFLTYGAVPLLVIPAGVWLYRRDLVPLLWAAVGAGAVTVAFWAGGFWWFDGLDATRDVYDTGVAADRPYMLFVGLLNPAAFALAAGPAVAAALGVWVSRRHQLPVTVWLLPILALGAVLAANVSGLSKAEVERIWLPFIPWLLVLTAVLPRPRLWLAVNVIAAVSLQLFLHSPW